MKIILRGIRDLTEQKLSQALRLRDKARLQLQEGYAYVMFEEDNFAEEFYRRYAPMIDVEGCQIYVNYARQQDELVQNDGSDDISDIPCSVLVVQEFEGSAQELFKQFYQYGAKHAVVVVDKITGTRLNFGFIVFVDIKSAHACMAGQSVNVNFAHQNSLHAEDDSTWVSYLKTINYWDDNATLQQYPAVPAQDIKRPAEFYNPEFGEQLDDIDQFMVESRKDYDAVTVEQEDSWGTESKALQSRSGLMTAFSKKPKVAFDVKPTKKVKLDEELEEGEHPTVQRLHTPDSVKAQRKMNYYEQAMVGDSFDEQSQYEELPEETIKQPSINDQFQRYHRDITLDDLVDPHTFVAFQRTDTPEPVVQDTDIESLDGSLTVAIPTVKQFIVEERLLCILCQRIFDSAMQLNNHVQQSELHSERYDSFVKDLQVFHAQESVKMFNLQIKKQHQKVKMQTKIEPQLQVGAQLLQKIGWQGAGLGRSQQGNKDLVEAGTHLKGKGIGYQDD